MRSYILIDIQHQPDGSLRPIREFGPVPELARRATVSGRTPRFVPQRVWLGIETIGWIFHARMRNYGRTPGRRGWRGWRYIGYRNAPGKTAWGWAKKNRMPNTIHPKKSVTIQRLAEDFLMRRIYNRGDE